MSEQIPFVPEPSDDLLGNRVANLAEELPEVEVEIVDDRPVEDQRPPRDEKKGASFDPDAPLDRTGDVDAQFRRKTYEYHEQRRSAEASERQLSVLTEFANRQSQELKDARTLLSSGENVLREEAYARNKQDRERAELAHKAAFDSGDGDALLQATQDLSRADVSDAVLAQTRKFIQPQEETVPIVSQERPAEPLLSSWLVENPWFKNPQTEEDHLKLTMCYGIDKVLQTRGVDPASEEYYEEVNNMLDKRFPSGNGMAGGGEIESSSGTMEPASKIRSRQVVASAGTGRSSAPVSSPMTVTLTRSEVAVAKHLNISNEDYAREKLRLRVTDQEEG